MENFLKNCGLSHATNLFEEHRIGIEQLEELIAFGDILKEVLPVVGDRLKLIKAVKDMSNTENVAESPPTKKIKLRTENKPSEQFMSPKKWMKNDPRKKEVILRMLREGCHIADLYQQATKVLMDLSLFSFDDGLTGFQKPANWTTLINFNEGRLHCVVCNTGIVLQIRERNTVSWNVGNYKRHFAIEHAMGNRREETVVNSFLEVQFDEDEKIGPESDRENAVCFPSVADTIDKITNEMENDPSSNEVIGHNSPTSTASPITQSPSSDSEVELKEKNLVGLVTAELDNNAPTKSTSATSDTMENVDELWADSVVTTLTKLIDSGSITKHIEIDPSSSEVIEHNSPTSTPSPSLQLPTSTPTPITQSPSSDSEVELEEKNLVGLVAAEFDQASVTDNAPTKSTSATTDRMNLETPMDIDEFCTARVVTTLTRLNDLGVGQNIFPAAPADKLITKDIENYPSSNGVIEHNSLTSTPSPSLQLQTSTPTPITQSPTSDSEVELKKPNLIGLVSAEFGQASMDNCAPIDIDEFCTARVVTTLPLIAKDIGCDPPWNEIFELDLQSQTTESSFAGMNRVDIVVMSDGELGQASMDTSAPTVKATSATIDTIDPGMNDCNSAKNGEQSTGGTTFKDSDDSEGFIHLQQVPEWKKNGVKFGWAKQSHRSRFYPGFLLLNQEFQRITTSSDVSTVTFVPFEFHETIDLRKKNKREIGNLRKFNNDNNVSFD